MKNNGETFSISHMFVSYDCYIQLTKIVYTRLEGQSV